MKTNFTLTKRILLAITLLAVVVSSCKDEDPVAPDIAGQYLYTSATLIDGDLSSGSSNMVIENGGGAGVTIDVEPGNVAETTFFTNSLLANLAPCVDVQIPATYLIDIKSDGKVAFICTSEDNVSEDMGTWNFADNNTSIVLNIQSPALGLVTVKIETATFTAATISGTIPTFPMVVNAGAPIGATNIQYISFSTVLTKQ